MGELSSPYFLKGDIMAKPQIEFDGKVWKQGNSLIITIPKHIRDKFSLKEGDDLRFWGLIINEQMKEYEREGKRLIGPKFSH